MATTDESSRNAIESSTTFHDLDELLLGPSDLEAMPFEFGCDFVSAFDDKHGPVDAAGANLRMGSAATLPRPTKEAKRSHKRKSDTLSTASRSLAAVAPPVVALATASDDGTDALGTNGSTQIGRWTKKEHELFLEGLRLYGKSWKKISSLVVTRTLVQIRTHAQKYLQKQTKSALKAAAVAAAAATGTSTTASSKSRKAAESDALWKLTNSHGHHANVFLPIAFPGHVPAASASSLSAASSAFSGHKDLGSMSKLDQLLHDDSHTTGHDDLYTSPTSSDDDLTQWLQHRHLPYVSSTSSSLPTPKRRRTDVSSSAWPIVNPMEALASASYYHGHNHHASSDFVPPLAAYAAGATTSQSESEFTFGHSWL